MKEYHIAVKGQQPGAFDEENDRHNAHAVKYPSDNRRSRIFLLFSGNW